jgi:hypothetical protein
MPAVYLVLGLPGSGRDEVVFNLIEGGMGDGQPVTVYHAAGEVADGGLSKRPSVAQVPFTFDKDHFTVVPGTEPKAEPEAAFFLTDGRASVIDQIEAFPAWLQAHGWELARILLVVDCALAAAHPMVTEWHAACVHFADCVLLNRRDAACHDWARDFQKKFAEARYPCVFVSVKHGRVANSLTVLFPEARRMTLVFDDIDPVDQLDLDEENLPEEPFTLENKLDPYFERLLSGHRVKPVPDVTAYLAKQAAAGA